MDVRREPVSIEEPQHSRFTAVTFRGGPAATIVNGAFVWRNDE